jgi:hypothetical protein
VQRAERGADLDVEVIEERAAHLLAVDALRDVHPGHVGHLVALVAEELEPHRLEAHGQRPGRPRMAGERLLEPFAEQDARAFACGVEHGGRFSVVVKRLVGPVVHDHREVEIVAADDRPVAVFLALLLESLLDVPPAHDHLFRPLVQGQRRTAGGAAQAFLQAGAHHVELPRVGGDPHPAERRGRVDIEQRVVGAAELAELGERLRHGRRGVAVRDRNNFWIVFFDCSFELLWTKDRAPLSFKGNDLGAEALRDLDLKVAEAAEHRNQHAIARLDQGS